MGGSSGKKEIFAKKINDDLLVEIFDFCRLDDISPNTYPRNWWLTLAHVCKKWRRVLFATPTRLGITLVCNSRTPVADLLANSPASLPLIVYWGNPGTFDTDSSVNNALLALKHRERVRRMTLRMSENSLRKVFSTLDGPFPLLETLQMHCLSENDTSENTKLPAKFAAPNLRHLQLSELTLLPQSLLDKAATRPSIVTLSIGEITIKTSVLMKYLALMPHLKVLKVGVSFSIPSEQTERKERELCESSGKTKSAPLALTDLEEFEYQGISDYVEALAARISAPFLKKTSITISNAIDDRTDLSANTFKHLSRLISGAANLAFPFCRIRFKDGFSVVMDHNELWTGRGAFELRFNHRRYYFDANIGFVAKVCRVLVPMPSTVQSLLLEDGHRNQWGDKPKREQWHELFRVFEDVKTLRVAGRFVAEVDKALEPKEKEKEADGNNKSVVSLLPRLQEIVRYGPTDTPFAPFVKARQGAGLSAVRVVEGPPNRLTLV